MIQEPIYINLPTGNSTEIKPVLCETRPIVDRYIQKHFPSMEFKAVTTQADFRIIESGTNYSVSIAQSPEECWASFKNKKYLGNTVTQSTMVALAETWARLVKIQHCVELKVVRNKVRNIY